MSELLDGPVSLHIALVVPPHRNWALLWKRAIDALDPLLGRTRPDRDWHPRDGRIVELALHRHVRNDGARHITLAIGAAAMQSGASITQPAEAGAPARLTSNVGVGAVRK